LNVSAVWSSAPNVKRPRAASWGVQLIAKRKQAPVQYCFTQQDLRWGISPTLKAALHPIVSAGMNCLLYVSEFCWLQSGFWRRKRETKSSTLLRDRGFGAWRITHAYVFTRSQATKGRVFR